MMPLHPARAPRRALPFAIALLLCGLLVALLPLRGRAQERTGVADRYALVYVLRGDTLGVERVQVAGGTVRGDLRLRGTPRIAWTQSPDADGSPGPLLIEAWAPNATDTTPPVQRLQLGIAGDSATVAPAAAPARVQRLASRAGARWLVNQSLAHAAVLIGMRRPVADGDTLPLVMAAGAQTFPGVLRTRGDTVGLLIAGLASAYRFDGDGRLVSAHVPSQGLEAFVVRGDALATLRLGAPDYDAPAGAPYTAEHVRIAVSDSVTLAATLTLPAARDGRVPVVVTISGSGPQDRDEALPGVTGYRPFRSIADTLARRGIATLRYDERGVGASTGSHAGASSRDFADDVRGLVAWIRAHPMLDGDRIALAGHSEGGLIAPLVAADDARIAAIALLAGPAYDGRRILAFQQREGIAQLDTVSPADRERLFADAQRQLDSLIRRDPWFAFFADHDPLPTLARVSQPVLVLQGETDRQVTPEQADTIAAALRAAGNARVTVYRLADTNHLFQRDALPPGGDAYGPVPARYARLPERGITRETLGLLADWLVTTLRP